MTSPFLCEEPRHDGDRLVRDPSNRVVVSEDHMLADGTVRLHRIHLLNVCRACSDRREAWHRPGSSVIQGTLT